MEYHIYNWDTWNIPGVSVIYGQNTEAGSTQSKTEAGSYEIPGLAIFVPVLPVLRGL